MTRIESKKRRSTMAGAPWLGAARRRGPGETAAGRRSTGQNVDCSVVFSFAMGISE